MEHLQHSFADHTRRGGFLKSLSDHPPKRRPADPRKRGGSFRRQRNKLFSRVKLRLRYRLSLLWSGVCSRFRNDAIPDLQLRLYSSPFKIFVAFSRPRLNFLTLA